MSASWGNPKFNSRKFATDSSLMNPTNTLPALKDSEQEMVVSMEGIPARELEREVIISRPTKNSMQSGIDKYGGWR